MKRVPELPAYESGTGTWKVWCDFCERWHWHSDEEGHRSPHCHDERSPYQDTGYTLVLAAGPAPRRRERRL